MAATLASDVISRARFVLADAGVSGGERFALPVLFQMIRDGVQEIYFKKPWQCCRRNILQLTANTVAQSLPSEDGGFRNGTGLAAAAFLAPVRNKGAAGTSMGDAILPASLEVMDNTNPSWASTTAAASIIHTMADPVSRRAFYVYPAPSSAIYIEVAYIPESPEVTATTDEIQLAQSLINALVQYVCYRCIQADTSVDANQNLATSFYNSFVAALEVPGAINQTANKVKP